MLNNYDKLIQILELTQGPNKLIIMCHDYARTPQNITACMAAI